MLNIEKYKDDLKEFFSIYCGDIAVVDNKPVVCASKYCDDCCADSCGENLIDWMLKEYKSTDGSKFE